MMAFARCIAGERDIAWSSPIGSAMDAPDSHSRGHLRISSLFNWTRKTLKSNWSSNVSDCKQDASSAYSEENQGAARSSTFTRPSRSSTTAPHDQGVVYRRSEKSFMDFHQRYAITRHLGEGSYSTVKQVTHRQHGGTYACKIVDKVNLSPADRVALAQEVQVLSTVCHDNIMRLYEVIEDDAKCYLIVEYAEHGDLFDKIVRQGRFREEEAQRIVGALVEALHHCHSHNVIHRDVKPENVLLSGDSVKLCDFGFAKQLNDALELAVDSCGTPGYAAPEILDGKPYGMEVDVFSLGVVTYIMLCGYPPFPMKLSQLRTHRFNVRFPPRDWMHIGEAVKDLIARMLHVKPDLRPTTSALRRHPWIRQGIRDLAEMRQQAEERKRLEELERKQQAADMIRGKLITTGYEVIKHCRQGLPHRTKLRLSADGNILSWQPKLLKRGLLHYQSAKSLTTMLGFRYGGGSSNLTGSGKESARSCASSAPSSSRKSSSEATEITSCPSEFQDEMETSMATATSGEMRECTLSSSCDDASLPTLSTSGSNTSTDRLNWWRSLRRPRRERSSSGGASFSPFRTTKPPSHSSGSTGLSGSHGTLDQASSSVGLSSVPSTPVALASPPTHTKECMLDTSISLRDIQDVVLGDDSEFFHARGHSGSTSSSTQGGAGNVDPSCVLSVLTRSRELHLEFSTEPERDAFAFLLEQTTLPLAHVPAMQHSVFYRQRVKASIDSSASSDSNNDIHDIADYGDDSDDDNSSDSNNHCSTLESDG